MFIKVYPRLFKSVSHSGKNPSNIGLLARNWPTNGGYNKTNSVRM